jgi:hypothetical protein
LDELPKLILQEKRLPLACLILQATIQSLFSNPQDAVGEFLGNKAQFSNLYPGVTFDYSVDGSKV